MARNSHELPDKWRTALRRAAQQAAQAQSVACSPDVADRIADAVIASLLSLAAVEEQVRNRPLIDPVPPGATMDSFAMERRLAICTPAEPCVAAMTDDTIDRYGHRWYPVASSLVPAEPCPAP